MLQTPGRYAGAHRKDGQACGRAVNNEEEPEELINSLHNDVFPHLARNKRLITPMRLIQQQCPRWEALSPALHGTAMLGLEDKF